MAEPSAARHEREREHGRVLAAGSPEDTWGWGTPAGKLRAARRAELILRGANIGAGTRVLEVGCGTGLFTGMFARSGARIAALDVSPELIARARARVSGDVTFIESTLEDWETTERFDAVIGSSVLHHIELDAALGKISSLLAPGGRISFAEPNMLNPQIYCERHFRRFFPQVSPDETAFVRSSLARALAANGFDDIAIIPFDWLHPATPAPLIPLVRSVGRVLESLPLAREFAGSLLITARRA